MNTEKVYITYDKNGDEVVVYKNNMGIYVDLFNKNKIYDDTDISSLIPFSTITQLFEKAKLIKAKKRLLGWSIRTIYNADRGIQLDTNSIYIGKLCRVSDITDVKQLEPGKRIIMQNGISDFIEPKNEYTFSLQTIDEKILLYKYDQVFLDLVGGEPYLGISQLDHYSKSTLNKMCIKDSNKDLIPFNDMFNKNHDRYITKKLVLEEFHNSAR